MVLESLLIEVRKIAAKAGAYISEEGKGFSHSSVQTKGGKTHDLVSYVDKTAESMILERLMELEPGASIISEETNPAYASGLNWIVDPLDGTTNFVQGIPHYCVSIALADGNDVLLGLVLEVNRNECFDAIGDKPSQLNGVEIRVSEKKHFGDAMVATGFSVKNHDELEKNLELLKVWIEKTRGIRRLGSAALDLCYVANGTFDLFYETNLSAWDVAGGSLIVKNAGGQVSDFKGDDGFLFGNEIMASNGFLHQSFQEQISNAFG